jgi:hypothetical protein
VCFGRHGAREQEYDPVSQFYLMVDPPALKLGSFVAVGSRHWHRFNIEHGHCSCQG